MLETELSTEGSASDDKVQHETRNGNIIHQNEVDYDLPPEECWLFRIPKSKHNSHQHVKPIQLWLREVFDSPDSCFYATRYSLINRLEAILLSGGPISAYRFGGSVPSLHMNTSGASGCLPTTKQFHFDAKSFSNKPDNNFGSNHCFMGWPKTNSSDSLQHSTNNMGTIIQNQRPDTSPGSSFSRVGSTFARIGLPKNSLPPQYSVSHQRRLSNMSSNSTSNLGHSVGQGFTGSISTTGSFDELQVGAGGKANVQEIARIQEDNLKAEVAALVAAAGRRGSQHSLSSLGRRSPEGGGGAVNDVVCPLAATDFRGSPTSNNLVLYHTSGSLVDHNDGCADVSQPNAFPIDVYDSAQYFPNSNNLLPSITDNQPYNPMSQGQNLNSMEQQFVTAQSARKMQVVTLLANTDLPTRPPLLPNVPTAHGGIPVSAEPRNQFGIRSIRRPNAPSAVRPQLPGSVAQNAPSRIPNHASNSGVLMVKHYD